MTRLMPDLDDTATPLYWEPIAFRVGDRVRVALSDECAQDRAGTLRGELTREEMAMPHWPQENGMIGVVVNIDRERESGHYYAVEFLPPRPMVSNGMTVYGVTYAAIEMILLERDVPLPSHGVPWEMALKFEIDETHGRLTSASLDGRRITDPFELEAVRRKHIPEARSI